ncbi:non-homologous end-joining DNA ligase [Acidicapsa dinghuensis]|uniref:Non-homologous end-joining DNA ligase n=1 Tax=Acidicapsa dinghuensis TaxID=2218256 RepID=A0ABW1EF31_9BACT|nr:non-homologous end-joining DNA ligase [Acidicapsa dinghuensis]
MSAKRNSKQKPAEAVEKQLERYREMRDFGITGGEPRGKNAAHKASAKLPFVVQKHAASHLHYDFRLGWNGVLKSWAVAKGPSMNPADKRLAIQVEDHPVEYGGFEGIIPQDQYGGGTVMVWDYGTWEPQTDHADVNEELEKGSLKFTLHGTKLKGSWALVRMKRKFGSETKPAWLLIKEHDRYERDAEDISIVDEKTKSALTGRGMEAISKSEDHVWAPKTNASASRKARHHQVQKMNRSTTKVEASQSPVVLTHPEKILDEESKLTKQQLADYYLSIADGILPHIANRPLSIVRCPQGSSKPCFFQKHATDSLSSAIESVLIKDKKSDKAEPYITISTKDALVELAQLGVLEIHPWGATNDDLEHPDRIIIDLDPDPSISWPTLAASAIAVRNLFKEINLDSFLKNTGGKGLHIVAPVIPDQDWTAIKQLAHEIALHLEKQDPRLFITKMSKAERKERIFVDYLRNERGATAVAPYSPRARSGAPVALPLPWSALDGSERPHAFVATAAEWNHGGDPWVTMRRLRQDIDLEKAFHILKT